MTAAAAVVAAAVAAAAHCPRQTHATTTVDTHAGTFGEAGRTLERLTMVT